MSDIGIAEPQAGTEAAAEPQGGAAEPSAAELLARLNAYERRNVFERVLPQAERDKPFAKFFIENYHGDTTEEAVSEAARSLGLIPDPTKAAEEAAALGNASPEEQHLHDLTSGMHAGAEALGREPGPHPRQRAMEAAEAVRKAGGTEHERLGAYFEARAISVVEGDRRGTIDYHAARAAHEAARLSAQGRVV